MIKQRSLLIYILLSIVTCGIYSIIFWYQLTNDINLICQGDEQDSPNYIIVILLSTITCGIYYYYWLYKQGNRLQQAAPRYGLNFSENGTTLLVWNLFGALLFGLGPLIALNILIKNMNQIAFVYK